MATHLYGQVSTSLTNIDPHSCLSIPAQDNSAATGSAANIHGAKVNKRLVEKVENLAWQRERCFFMSRWTRLRQ